MSDGYEPEVGVPIEGQLTPEQQRFKDEAQEREERRQERAEERSFRIHQRTTNREMVMVTMIGVAVALLGSVITGVLGLVQARMTQKAIETANRQAKAAEEANAQAREAAKDAKESSILAAKESAKANAENEAQSRKSFAETIRQNRLDQRAWVGVKNISVPEIAVGQKVGFRVNLVNTGKTVGLNIAVKCGGKFLPGDTAIDTVLQSEEWQKIRPKESGILFPAGELYSDTGLSATEMDAALVKAIEKGNYKLYVFGKCEYIDIFRVKHRTEFCQVYRPDVKALSNCDVYNSAT
jgi:hypothetical protein